MPSQSEIRQQIADQIVDALSCGDVPPWRKPWTNDPNAGLPANVSSGNRYRGVNPILLEISRMKQGFESKWWATYRQIQQLGESVCKGQKGTSIIFYKKYKVTKPDPKTCEEKEESIQVLRYFTVFNVEQTTGLKHLKVGFSNSNDIPIADRYREAQALIESIGPDIRHGGNRAYYSPANDRIQLPFIRQFESESEYFHTTFHELIHWSGASNRLNRNELSYGFEELVAEIGACFTSTEVGIPVTEDLSNVKSYLGCWLKAIKTEPQFIFKAASHASKAADYLLAFQPSVKPEAVPAA